MAYFSTEILKKFESEYRAVNTRYQQLLLEYSTREYSDPKAKEYATHGFLRRLKILVRCIVKVFELLPPNRDDLPTGDEISDAMINIHAFVFNIFGSIDNLAWIWVQERQLKKKDGSPLPSGWIGLSPSHKYVRNSFSEEFQVYLKRTDQWFENMGNFRHALAHRIPLYIPPYAIIKTNEAAYRDFDHKMEEAVRRLDFAERDRLSIEQLKLASFRPWIQHSFDEGQAPIVFHGQLLTDFLTIDELGRKMLEELDRIAHDPLHKT